eukprot:m.417297 g.417297  ORF g.417297 m.417297 type:complete len:121 (-) comp16833_c0_seq13:436-798(-)
MPSELKDWLMDNLYTTQQTIGKAQAVSTPPHTMVDDFSYLTVPDAVLQAELTNLPTSRGSNVPGQSVRTWLRHCAKQQGSLHLLQTGFRTRVGGGTEQRWQFPASRTWDGAERCRVGCIL